MTSRPAYLERSRPEFERTVADAQEALGDLLRAVAPDSRTDLETVADDFIAAADSVLIWMQQPRPRPYDEKVLAAWGDLWQNFRAKHRKLSKAKGFQGVPADTT